MRSDDEVLVTRCLEGDQPAFAFLVNKYKEVVHAYAYRKVADYQQAEDITQEVFIKAYRKLAQLKWPHRFQSWLYAITSNECKLWLRRHSKEQEQEVSWEEVPAKNLDELAVRAHSDEDIKLTVRSAMETLPDDRQLVLSLFYMSSMSIKEIAYFMGVSPNSIGIKLHRARKQLGERLEKMIGKQLGKEKLRSGFVFKVVESIRDMPIPSLPKPGPIRWAPIPISIGLALLIGIIGYGVSPGRDVSSDMPILRPAEATFEVSLLPDPDGQMVLDAVLDKESLDMGSEDIYQSDLASADAGTTMQTRPAMGTASSGIVVRRVWDNAHDFMGKISPDGRYLSYVNWDKGNVAIHDFETGENRDVTDEGNWDEDEQFADRSIWSPDSKQIAYIWDKGEEISLRIVGIDGSKPRVLFSSSGGSEVLFPLEWVPLPLEWSRDGKHILAFHCKQKGKPHTPHAHDIVLVSVADGSIRVLKSLDRPSRHLRMSLSPDSRYVVYDYPQNEGSPERDIFLAATDGSHEMTLVKHPANDFSPFWTPDGDRIVFASGRSGSMGIWVLEVVDGKPKGSPQLIKHNLNGMVPLGVTQEGSYYYALRPGVGDVYVATLDPETGEVVIPPAKAIQSYEGFNIRPDFSPDGKYLAYVSRRPRGTGYSTIVVIHSLETGEERELQSDIPLDMQERSAPRWFPDGHSILVLAKVTDSAKESRKGFYQIDVETGAVTPVVLDDELGSIFGPTAPVWSPDGSKIFFHRKGGGIRIYDLEAEREWKPKFLQWPAGGKDYDAGLAISPDGRQLAFTVNFDNERAIHIAPSTGGEMREIARLRKEEAAWGRGLTWTSDGRHLLFLGKHEEADGSCELRRVSVEGGESQNLGLKVAIQTYLSVHPDGRRIAFTGPGPTPGAEVWAMENFLSTSTASR